MHNLWLVDDNGVTKNLMELHYDLRNMRLYNLKQMDETSE